ncbi:MAG: hypothetical protein KIT84_07610 [Labilithrix sp.]|nr:hypothetical protein [Labilithrix sp.]MCW5810862.1 hypothetical protein [Labilithrix sp.]
MKIVPLLLTVTLLGACSAPEPEPEETGSTESSMLDHNERILEMQRADQQQAQDIFRQVAEDTQRQRAERWAILQETQRKIAEMTAQIEADKARAAARAAQASDAGVEEDADADADD